MNKILLIPNLHISKNDARLQLHTWPLWFWRTHGILEVARKVFKIMIGKLSISTQCVPVGAQEPSNVRHTATHCNALQHAATHCNTLQRTATHCDALQHTATHCDALRRTATHCNTLQHTATHCNTLQHTRAIECATHCNTHHTNVRHTATHRNACLEVRKSLGLCYFGEVGVALLAEDAQSVFHALYIYIYTYIFIYMFLHICIYTYIYVYI